jgi:hypothetical protein
MAGQNSGSRSDCTSISAASNQRRLRRVGGQDTGIRLQRASNCTQGFLVSAQSQLAEHGPPLTRRAIRLAGPAA